MNWWVTNTTIVAAVAAVLVSVSACSLGGEDVGTAQASAQTELETMRFLDGSETTAQAIGSASSAEEVERLLDQARSKNDARADEYWACADDLRGVLVKEPFVAQVVGDGQFDMLRLIFREDGVAALTHIGSAEMVSAFEPTEFQRWLTGHVGAVQRWSANADTLIDQRQLVERDTSPYVAGAGECVLHFDLVLGTRDGSETTTQAYFKRHRGLLTLFINGEAFSWGEE